MINLPRRYVRSLSLLALITALLVVCPPWWRFNSFAGEDFASSPLILFSNYPMSVGTTCLRLPWSGRQNTRLKNDTTEQLAHVEEIGAATHIIIDNDVLYPGAEISISVVESNYAIAFICRTKDDAAVLKNQRILALLEHGPCGRKIVDGQRIINDGPLPGYRVPCGADKADYLARFLAGRLVPLP